jgi:hypothetical protein
MIYRSLLNNDPAGLKHVADTEHYINFNTVTRISLTFVMFNYLM